MNPIARLIALALVATGIVLAIRPAQVVQAVDARAFAQILDPSGRTIGMADFVENAAGDVTVTVSVTGLTPGEHGLHMHAIGQCVGPDFATAGGHFNPLNRRHGLQTSEGAHSGDLPNIRVGADGRGRFSKTVASFRLSPGTTSLNDPDGSAIVIHAASDDGMTDATGNSGGRVACGIIVHGMAPPLALMPLVPGTIVAPPHLNPPNTGDAGLAALKPKD